MVVEPIAQAAQRAAPFAVVAVVAAQEPGRTDHRPAVWSDGPAVVAAQAAAVARAGLVAQVVVWVARVAPGGARRGAVVTAFCLPARPGSRRYYRSLLIIP